LADAIANAISRSIVGNDTIRELLDIPTDVEGPPVTPTAGPPSSPTEPPHARTPVVAHDIGPGTSNYCEQGLAVIERRSERPSSSI